MGHSKAFMFAGEWNNKTSYVATFKNAFIEGNVSNIKSIIDAGDAEASAKASGSLIMVTSLYCDTQVKNTIVNSALIGMYSERNESVESSTSGLHADKVKVYNCYNCALFCYDGSNNSISNSTLHTFGGPAIFLISNHDDKGTDKEKIWKASCVVDTNTTISNEVMGTEAWFSLVGADLIIPQITQLSVLLERQCNLTFIKSNGKMDMLELSMDGAYLESKELNVYTTFQYQGYPLVLNGADSENPIFQALFGTQYKTPILMTNARNIGYIAPLNEDAEASETNPLVIHNLSDRSIVTPESEWSGTELYLIYPTNGTSGTVFAVTLKLSAVTSQA